MRAWPAAMPRRTAQSFSAWAWAEDVMRSTCEQGLVVALLSGALNGLSKTFIGFDSLREIGDNPTIQLMRSIPRTTTFA